MGEYYNKYVGKIKFLGFEKKGCFVNFDSYLFFLPSASGITRN